MSEAPLIMGQSQCADLRELRERATAMPVDMKLLVQRLDSPGGRDLHVDWMSDNLTVEIPTAYRVTFSIEINHPVGTCRHMSMSSMRPGKAPTPAAVVMVAHELGFVGGLDACRVWMEDIGRLPNGKQQVAINIAQPLTVGEAHYA